MEEKLENVMESGMALWEEADKQDKLNSRFFTLESNMRYKLTFSKEPMDDPDYLLDKKCITGRIVKRLYQIWENGQKTNKSEEKFVLQLVVDSLDGSPCRKIWNCKNAKMRSLFRTYAENGLLTKKVFVVEVKGELIKGNYNVVALDKSGQDGLVAGI